MTESGKVLPYLQGIKFPARKEYLVIYAVNNDAPDDIILILKSLEKTQFFSLSEVIRELEIEGYEK
jgi:hypothetical protein